MDRNLTNKEKSIAQDAVDKFNQWSLLGKNTKIMEDWKTYQIRIGDCLRVQFKLQEDWEKEIVDIFKKKWHESHR